MTEVPKEAGKSSIDLLDVSQFLDLLPLGAADSVLDLGCGVGNYALRMAERMKAGASLTGVDLWPQGVEEFNQRAVAKGLSKVAAKVAPLTDLGFITSGTVDLALMATVLHDLAKRGDAGAALKEAARVVKKNGILAVVEFKKEDQRPGPPMDIKLSPEEVSMLLEEYPFVHQATGDLGQHLYLMLFQRS